MGLTIERLTNGNVIVDDGVSDRYLLDKTLKVSQGTNTVDLFIIKGQSVLALDSASVDSIKYGASNVNPADNDELFDELVTNIFYT